MCEHMFNSTLRYPSVGYSYFVYNSMSSTKEKLDALIKSVADLMWSHKVNQHELDTKLKQLEKDVATAQEDATERATKRPNRNCPVEFKWKGHQEQYVFNKEVEDHLEAAAKR